MAASWYRLYGELKLKRLVKFVLSFCEAP